MGLRSTGEEEDWMGSVKNWRKMDHCNDSFNDWKYLLQVNVNVHDVYCRYLNRDADHMHPLSS